MLIKTQVAGLASSGEKHLLSDRSDRGETPMRKSHCADLCMDFISQLAGHSMNTNPLAKRRWHITGTLSMSLTTRVFRRKSKINLIKCRIPSSVRSMVAKASWLKVHNVYSQQQFCLTVSMRMIATMLIWMRPRNHPPKDATQEYQ